LFKDEGVKKMTFEENNSSNSDQQKFSVYPIVINNEEKGGYFSVNYYNKPREEGELL
jgi:hypothetical protein